MADDSLSRRGAPLVIEGALSGPQLCVQGRCNLRCLYCNLFGDAPTVAPGAHAIELRGAIGELAARGATQLAWGVHHREPTTFEGLPDLVAHASSLGIVDNRLITNGLLTADLSYMQELARSGITGLNLSLFEWDAASSDVIAQGERVLERKIATLENCTRLGVRVFASLLVMRANYLHIREIIELFRPFVPSIVVEPLYPGQASRVPWFLPPLSGLCRSLSEAVAEVGVHGVRTGSVPTCIHERYASAVPGCSRPQMEFVGACAACARRVGCCGVRPEYLKIYGDREITHGEHVEAPMELDELLRRCQEAIAVNRVEAGAQDARGASGAGTVGQAERRLPMALSEAMAGILLPAAAKAGLSLTESGQPHHERLCLDVSRGQVRVSVLVATASTTPHAYLTAGPFAILLPRGAPPLSPAAERVLRSLGVAIEATVAARRPATSAQG